jgi:CRP-like cAMP-binding protein
MGIRKGVGPHSNGNRNVRTAPQSGHRRPRRGDLVGELGIFSDHPATATAVAATPLRVQRREPEFRLALDAAFNANLRHKLTMANRAGGGIRTTRVTTPRRKNTRRQTASFTWPSPS